MYIYQTMSNNFGYIDIILLGMIAGFIILRLRNILGRKLMSLKSIQILLKKNLIYQNEIKAAPQNLEVLEGNDKKEFLKGAEIAYETILTSFARGDIKKLKSLLTSDMADNFEQAIKERNRLNIKSEFTFIGLNNQA